MSTNPFVCQPNSQKIGGFLPFVRGSCAGLIATRRSTPTVSSRMKRVPRPYKTKVPHAEWARACDVIRMKMMDCLALETLVVNHEPMELIDVRSREEFAAMHIPGARSVPFGELAATRIFRREAPDDRARLCHFRRRSHSSQPCNGDSAIGRLRECRSGRRRNEGLGRPGFSIAAQEILDQPCGRFHTEGSVACDGSRRGGRTARVYGRRSPASLLPWC